MRDEMRTIWGVPPNVIQNHFCWDGGRCTRCGIFIPINMPGPCHGATGGPWAVGPCPDVPYCDFPDDEFAFPTPAAVVPPVAPCPLVLVFLFAMYFLAGVVAGVIVTILYRT